MANSFKNDIQNLQVGHMVWNVCGLAPITEIVKTGYSELVGGYCHAKTRFSKDSTMSFFISEHKAVIVDGYLCNSDHLQFIQNQKASDYTN